MIFWDYSIIYTTIIQNSILILQVLLLRRP